MASPSAGAPALKYGDVNIETTSPGEVKGLKEDKNNNNNINPIYNFYRNSLDSV